MVRKRRRQLSLEELKKLHAEYERRPGIDALIAEADAVYHRLKDQGLLRRTPEAARERQRLMDEWRASLRKGALKRDERQL
jgi:hypothetical protein